MVSIPTLPRRVRLAALMLVLASSCSTPASKYQTRDNVVPNLDNGKWWPYLRLTNNVPVPGEGFQDRYGVASEDGEIILEPIYSKLRVVSNRIAWVERDGELAIFDMANRAFLQVKYEGIHSFGKHFMGFYWHGDPQLMDAYLLDRSTGNATAILKDLDGYTLLKDMLIVHKTLEDGSEVSQVLSATGNQISPVIGRVYGKFLDGITMNLSTKRGEVSAEVANLPNRNLYLPLGESGTPLDLPADCIGLLALGPYLIDPEGPFEFNMILYGWAIVYETPQGLEFSPVAQSVDPAEALAQAEFLPRYTQLSAWLSVGEPYFSTNSVKPSFLLAKNQSGYWEMLSIRDLEPFHEPGELDPGYESIAELKGDLSRVFAERKRVADELAAAERATQLRLEEETYQSYRARFDAFMAEGQSSLAWELGRYNDRIFVDCMDQIGSHTIKNILRYASITGSHKYDAEIQEYHDAVAAHEQEEYERQAEIAADIARSNERETYRNRNDWSSGGESLFDQSMKHSKAWRADNHSRAVRGANVVDYPGPN